MRVFTGLHRIVIVIAAGFTLYAGGSSYDDYNRLERHLSNLKSGDLEVSVDGQEFTAPVDADDADMLVAAWIDGGEEVDVEAVMNALKAEQADRQNHISEEEESLADRWFLPLMPVLIGLLTYLAGLAVLLVARWIMRGFLAPSADRTDSTSESV